MLPSPEDNHEDESEKRGVRQVEDRVSGINLGKLPKDKHQKKKNSLRKNENNNKNQLCLVNMYEYPHVTS